MKNLLSALKALAKTFLRLKDKTHALVRALVTVSFFLVIAKSIAAIKEVIVAHNYGTNAELEAYLFLFNLFSIPASIGYCVYFSLLVPLFSDPTGSKNDELYSFKSESFGLTLLFGTGLAVCVGAATTFWLQSGGTGLSTVSTAIALKATWPLCSIIPIALLAALWSTWIMAYGGQTNTLFEAGPALGIALAIVILPLGTITPLLYGTLTGYIIQLMALAYVINKTSGFIKPTFKIKSKYWKTLQSTAILTVLSQGFVAISGLLDLLICTSLGQGNIATLGYANRVMALFLGLLATAVGRSTLPILSMQFGKDPNEALKLASRWIFILGGIGVIIAIVLMLVSESLVKATFERGAFTDNDTLMVSDALAVSASQIPFYTMEIVAISFLTSSKRYKEIFLVSMVGFIAKAVSAFALTNYFGLHGLILSNSVMHFIILSSCLYFIAKTPSATTRNLQ